MIRLGHGHMEWRLIRFVVVRMTPRTSIIRTNNAQRWLGTPPGDGAP